MTGSSSSGTRSRSRRCPKCRRRISKFALKCHHCTWKVPYRPLYMTLIGFSVGIVGFFVLRYTRAALNNMVPTSPIEIKHPGGGKIN